MGYAALAPSSPLSSPMHRLQSRVWYIGDANSHVCNLRRRCFDLRVEEAGWRGGVVARGPTAARLLLFLALPEQAHGHTTPARRLRLGDSVSSTDASAACHVGFEGCSQQRGIRCASDSGVGLRLPPQQRSLGPKGQRAKQRPMHGQRAQRCAPYWRSRNPMRAPINLNKEAV